MAWTSAVVNEGQRKTSHEVEMSLQRLETEETNLAEKLRSCCNLRGREKEKTRMESASVLEKIGKIYLEKAKLQSDMDQKLSYIRCAVLLHAARTRFRILENEEKVTEVKLVCRRLSKSILRSCGSNSEDDLTLISEKIRDGLLEKRKRVKRILEQHLNPAEQPKCRPLEKLEMLAQNMHLSMEDVELKFSKDKEVEKSVIKKVKAVNEQVTEMYKTIMQEITDSCLRLLPPPPDYKFSIIGFGSLAREEITLYSDFEHAILLEDGVDQTKDYQSVLEYFRWSSVLFQIIVIGLGETIIPSVAIKSLNDAYSGDPHRDWFYDSFTPKGVSFDGMLPHSCNIPLGRQQKTKERSHIVELIKTPQRMAEYLTHEEDLKNGYYLADVLRQTCLVYGSGDVYNSFIEARDRVLEKNRGKMREHDLKSITENTNRYVQYPDFTVTILLSLDSKHVFYRPLSTYIGCFAKLHGIQLKSTFTLIETLHENGLLNSSLLHQLSYAFAVACEIRMKLYHLKEDTRQAVKLEDLYETVGEDAVIACKWMMDYCFSVLDCHVRSTKEWNTVVEVRKFNEDFAKSSVNNLICNLVNRGLYMKAITLHEKLAEHPDPFVNCGRDNVMISAYCRAGGENEYRRAECYPKAEAIFSRIGYSKCRTGSEKLGMATRMARLFELKGKTEKAMIQCEEYFVMQHRMPIDDALFAKMCSMYYIMVCNSGLTFEEQERKLRTALWGKFDDNLECQLWKRFHLAKTGLMKDTITAICCRNKLASISVDFRKFINRGKLSLSVLNEVVYLQVNCWWPEDAAQSIALMRQYPVRATKEEALVQNINMGALQFLCLCRIGKYSTRSYEAQDLLKMFVSLLWTGIIHYPIGANDVSIVVLLWVIHLRITKHYTSNDMFSKQMDRDDSSRGFKTRMAEAAFMKFARCDNLEARAFGAKKFAGGRKQSEGTFRAAVNGSPYAILLLEKSLSDFYECEKSAIVSLGKNTAEFTKKVFQLWCKWSTARPNKVEADPSENINMDAEISNLRRLLRSDTRDLLKRTVSMAWRGIHLFSHGDNHMLIVILFESIHHRVEHSRLRKMAAKAATLN